MPRTLVAAGAFLLLVVVCSAAVAKVATTRRHAPAAASPVAVVGRTVVTESDLSVAARSYGPRQSRAELLSGLVANAVLVDEARRLHLLGRLTLHVIAARPWAAATLNQRLYAYAARSVPLPADRRVRAYAKLVAAAAGEEAEAIENGLGEPADAVAHYDAWLTRRDRVASAWFGRLYRRYRLLTVYPARHP
jgi:hypothetical protein